MLNSPGLLERHPLLTDGLNDGFRTPTLGWVGTKSEGAEVGAEQFHCGDLVFSNFWIGRAGQARAFAEALVQDIQGWLPDMVPVDTHPDATPILSVGYWEHGHSDLGMVMLQSLTEDLMLDALPASFGAVEDFAGLMHLVASDADDNSPHSVLGGIAEVDALERADAAELVIACVPVDEQDGLRDFYESLAGA